MSQGMCERTLCSCRDRRERERWFVLKIHPGEAQTKTEHGMMVLRHRGAPLVAESPRAGVGRLLYLSAQSSGLRARQPKGSPHALHAQVERAKQ